jgi:hypothetical protein
MTEIKLAATVAKKTRKKSNKVNPCLASSDTFIALSISFCDFSILLKTGSIFGSVAIR